MTQVTEEDLRVNMEQLFVSIDTNGNGRLEFDEVKQFTMKLHEQNKPGEPFDEDAFEDTFDKMDKDGSMCVSKMELFKSMCEKAQAEGRLA